MTKAEFKKHMAIWGDDFAENTCDKLCCEVVKQIMNNKATTEFQKMTMIRQYLKNLVTNRCVLENLPR